MFYHLLYIFQYTTNNIPLYNHSTFINYGEVNIDPIFYLICHLCSSFVS